MSADLLGAYRPGTTFLHRLPAGAKLGGLAVLSIVVVVLRGPTSALVLLVLSLGLVVWSGTRPRVVLRTLRGLLVVAVLLGSYQAWQRGAGVATEVVADLLTLVLASLVLTATTPVDAVLDALVRALAPLRRPPLDRWGVDPDRVALAFSLVLRAVPETLATARRTRDAARARGLDRSPRAHLVPFTLRVIADARATGEALAARGVAD